jgi:hypothetical protein
MCQQIEEQAAGKQRSATWSWKRALAETKWMPKTPGANYSAQLKAALQVPVSRPGAGVTRSPGH